MLALVGPVDVLGEVNRNRFHLARQRTMALQGLVAGFGWEGTLSVNGGCLRMFRSSELSTEMHRRCKDGANGSWTNMG